MLVELAGLLNKMFDEVMSSDFDVFIAEPGKKFKDKVMEDAEGDLDQVGIQDASVLCTTHLGLIKWLPVGALWERGKKQRITVLKAKVLLESSLIHENHTLHSISTAISWFKRGDLRVDEPIVMASTAELALPSSVHDEPPHSQTTHHEAKDTLATVLLYAESNKRNSADAEDAVQTTRGSEEIEKPPRNPFESHSEVTDRMRCEAQSRALDGSNCFVNIADKSSDSDVILALQRLNDALQQNASYMADCLAEDFEFKNVTTNPTTEQIAAVHRASDHIGRILAESLGKNKPEDTPMLLQITLQAYLASALCLVISSWAYDPGVHAFIYGIYQRLRRVGEKQNVRMRPLFQLMRRKNG